MVLCCQQEKLFQFLAEKFLSASFVWCFGVVKGQRGQCVECPETAGISSINGFNAEDADNDVGRYTVLLFGSVEIFFIRVPEADSGIDPDWFNHSLTIGLPVFCFARS